MISEELSSHIAKELHIKKQQTDAVIKLLDEGNTVPFIARYRKEATGELDEEQIRNVEERANYLRNLIKRQEEVLSKIEEQGKLTPELQQAIEHTIKLQDLEDLYLPYKQKKRTRAQIAREKGLEPLAEIILQQKDGEPALLAAAYINEEKEVASAEEALAGAQDIIAENTAERADIRAQIRKQIWQFGEIKTELVAKNEDSQAFLMYEDYNEPIRTLPSHRILAINRGEKKEALKVKLTCDHEKNIELIASKIIQHPSAFSDLLQETIADCYKRLLFPALEREIRSSLTENAENQAIRLFGLNLKQLLLQAPLSGHTVMGLDPGYRTGCKMAIVDPTGNVLDHGVLYLTMSDDAREKSAKKVLDLIKKHNVSLISIGNGTASYETEEFTAKLIEDNHLSIHYIITSEAGASVYSASKLAKEELPDYDVTIRGAVSIARRIQDPLAELVKIDPKAIGVGQYQHDVNQKELAGTLDTVIDSAVNHVGVELNTASIELLKHISGINASVAKNIVAYRNENGSFKNRKELLKVARLGQAAFTQCAGFLRIGGAALPLDNTPVHPESYKLTEALLGEIGFSLKDLEDKKQLEIFQAKLKLVDIDKLAEKLDAGAPTVRDIFAALIKPGRDPREDLPAPLTRKAIVKLTDIKVGTIMRGTVRNITDFGAFVDIGIKTAGLIHRSELSYQRVKHPLDVVSVGDVLDVMVISIDAERNRIGLSLKQVPKEA
jgi:uncharacterized protein